MTTLTAEYTKRVNSEIAEVNAKIAKEMNYSEDLRNNSRIYELKNHIVKLQNMIVNGWNAPKFN